MKHLTLIAVAATVILSATPAWSQNAGGLTEPAVRQFYAELPNLFKGPYEQFLAAYTARAADNLQIVNKTTIYLPGQPASETTETLNKQQLLTAAPQAYEAAQSAKLSNQVLSVIVSPDGKTAKVREISRIEGMSAPGADAAHAMKASSQEVCTDELAFDPTAGIQMVKSQCDVSVRITATK